MSRQDVTLHDKFDLGKDHVLLNGTQALVRLMLMQKARDKAAGMHTAGLVTGYRGSPLGAVDMQMMQAKADLEAADVVFQPGLNEDLAATALWGAQQAELRGEGKFDGVFGMWYGKGPGVDRSGDVMRHANMAGTSAKGGVLMVMGDDHTGESSTTLHQSDWALVDAYMPVLSPAGVQEVLDYGLYGFALSRYAGLWVGLKAMKDTIEATAVVDGRAGRMDFVTPDIKLPEGGLNIRLGDTAIPQEERIINHKKRAAEAFARANKIDRRMHGKTGAKIGLVAAGKNWLDLVHAFALLGIDAAEAERLGITTYKVGQVWPLDMQSFHDFAEGLDVIIVVEEKRKLIELQVKEAIFDDRRGRRVYGGMKEGAELFPTAYALEPVMIARKIGAIFEEEGCGSAKMKGALQAIESAQKADNAPEIAARIPYFCSGCPHNSSTKVPEGSRAYAGIGCHFMVQWMDRNTLGYTHMGAEGANWIGEAPFSKTGHVFQNLGDGTYNHSGIQAIRAAVAAGTTMTYKILFNDAVAMTGGQSNEGDLSADQITRELVAMGIEHVAFVYDEKEDYDLGALPKSVRKYHREELMRVQQEFSKIKGVSAIVYAQTCAAEKRRRRKRGTFPDIDKRVFINTDICEGCGDCGVQSNCVSITPVETELGRKRAIDQSSCNKDLSCVNGFCPSFVTVEGAKPRKAATIDLVTGDLPMPDLPAINGTHNSVITGVGGTGVVTIGAIMAMAAHLDGKGAGMMEMAGLAQKGGAVAIHCRIAARPEDISAIRVATGEADALIGGDLVVSAGAKTLGLTSTGRTGAVVNSHEIITGDFTRNTEFTLPSEALTLSLQARIRDRLTMFDASELARAVMGDSIFSNMMIFGAAWQQGLIPLTLEAITRAISLNGAAPERNLRAFEIGRWAALHPERAQSLGKGEVIEKPRGLAEKIAFRADHLTQYQSAAYARRYSRFVEKFKEEALREAVALSYHKLLSYKDEYEVARLMKQTRARAEEAFEGDLKLTYHLAPPVLGGKDAIGRPKKRGFGEGLSGMIMRLAALKRLRGTPFDPFGYSKERRAERALIKSYEADMKRILRDFAQADPEAILALARLPMQIRGFGPVKMAAIEAAQKRRGEIWQMIEAGDAPQQQAAQ
ncbi:MAG: indolepyruvate ferredoxin oxidoreductase family protein [Paracoccaceae bacterium]